MCFSALHVSFLRYFVFTCVFVLQLNSLHSELATQMADSMVFPLIQFREKDLTGRDTNTNAYSHIPIETMQFDFYLNKLSIAIANSYFNLFQLKKCF